MDYEKIISKLKEYKEELIALKLTHHSQGNSKELKNKVKMVIRRVYPNYEDVEKKLFPRGIYIATGTSQYDQHDYIRDIEKIIGAIDIILEEFELFGFQDFEPVKKKIESELKLGIKNSFWRRKTQK
jgi:hypothetical protein